MTNKITTYCRGSDRRQGGEEVFPLVTANGEYIACDRRCAPRRDNSVPLSVSSLLFRGVQEEDLREILDTCPVVTFKERETVLVPGQVNDKLYIIISGHMTVRLGKSGASHNIAIGPGHCVGEMSIADCTPVSAEVIAESGCRVLLIDEKVVWEQLVRIPGIARNLLVNQAERLRQTNNELVERMRHEMEYQQLERDLLVATQIQSSMVPRNFPLYPDRDEFDVFATMVPAQEVAGDFYDIFLIDHNQLFFIVGDVSGKGIAAALFMARVITLFRATVSPTLAIDEIMRRVNAQLCQNNDTCMFVTVLCGTFDITTGVVSYANGGHCPPLVGSEHYFRYLDMPVGRLLGINDELDFSLAEMTLHPGEMMVIYTDGVTEAYNRTNELFSDERLLSGLNEIGSANVTNTVLALNVMVSHHANDAPQSDDITVLAIKNLAYH